MVRTLLNKLHIKRKLELIYSLFPFIFFTTKNRFELILSILRSSSKYKIKLKTGEVVELKSSQLDIILPLLGVINFSTSCFVKSRNILELSFDENNKFTFSLENLSLEDENLLRLLFEGVNHGANFVTNDQMDVTDYRDKTLKIIQADNKKIVETSNGISFYVDSINPGNTIKETFLNNIHLINSHDDWNGKIVVDVGAECGDTPLYYASMGARVYAFEPMKAHFDAMLRNISLNPEISERIVPINAAIGKDATLEFYSSNKKKIEGGASFVYGSHGKNDELTRVKGYSLESAVKEFSISHIDLLKMDSKGAELYLTENALKNVKRVKIEYLTLDSSHKLEDLLKMLKGSGFDCMIYRHATNYISTNKHGTVYGKRH